MVNGEEGFPSSEQKEKIVMSTKQTTGRPWGAMIWGFVAGALVLAIVGFTWGGWYGPGGAENYAQKTADAAVASALAPICAEQFVRTATADEKEAFVKAASYERGNAVEKAVKLPGLKSMGGLLKGVCAEEVVKQITITVSVGAKS
ncbi:hypothetical protein HY418_00540 [Candidatus Kaiserbacteria bacterium]|nr:hypothetical protein [Candidatus Kaiserbacteria bacterium]